jgi:DNA-binding beta-propeller fold protein YncE
MNTPTQIVRALRTLAARPLTAIVLAVSLLSPLSQTRSADPTNDLFVASFSSGNVTRINGTTGALVYAVSQGGSTISLAKGPDGELYVSRLFSSSVSKTDLETGAPLGTFASGGGLSTAVGVTFGADGNLYVASRGTDSVLRYNGTTGAFINTFVAPASGGLSATESLLFGPDGNLYVTEFSGNRVLRYNGTTGAFIGVFASSPSLSGARGLAFGPDGNLYVAGNFSDNVVRFDGQTGASLGVFSTGIDGANGIAFGPDGNLYVAAEFADAIVRVNGSTGAFMNNFATVTGPIGILFDVAPAFNGRKLKQDAIADLTPLLAGPDRKRIEAAISHIEDSLAAGLWADNSHLTAQGKQVFDAERKAVNELGKVKQSNATIDAVIASLVEVDATLAEIAVEEATDDGGAARLLAAAQRHLDRAGRVSGANDAERMIQAYRAAWIAAQHSLQVP